MCFAKSLTTNQGIYSKKAYRKRNSYSKQFTPGNINFNQNARGGFVEQGISFSVLVTTTPKSKPRHSRIYLPTLHLAAS